MRCRIAEEVGGFALPSAAEAPTDKLTRFGGAIRL